MVNSTKQPALDSVSVSDTGGSSLSAQGETRHRLLITAMHLYAKEGLHAVSLRRISVAAGSKNSAAMHYHFHNKLGVIAALVELIALELKGIAADLAEAEAELQAEGAPWTPGRIPNWP